MTLNEWFQGQIEEIHEQYVVCRRSGKNRAEAITELEAFYQEELEDSDDAVKILICLASALSKKKELTDDMRRRTLAAIEKAVADTEIESGYKRSLLKFAKRIQNEAYLGPEAVYRNNVPYIADWQPGDLFTHTITDPEAKRYGLWGWTILLYKVNEYWNSPTKLHHLMYAAICPSDQIPSTYEERQTIQWLRMQQAADKWDYLLQVSTKSKWEELSYGLTKIGNFSDIPLPEDRSIENPYVSRVLYGKAHKDDLYPGFEEYLAREYYFQNKKMRRGKGDGSVVPTDESKIDPK